MRVTLVAAIGLAVANRSLAQAPDRLAVDPSRLVAYRDSFAVTIQGIPIGYLRHTLEPVAGGFRYSEESKIEGLVDETTTIELDDRGAMKTVHQRGTVQGQNAAVDVEYGAGRVRGTASTTGGDGPKTVPIDTIVPAGTLDDSAIQPLLPALPLAPGAAWSVGVFTAAANEYRVTTLKVTSADTLPGAGAPIETLKVEWTGVLQATTFWVSTGVPRRIEKIAIAGSPVEIVRVAGK
jgi:hypothetical protein